MDLIGRASNMGILQKHIPQLRFPDFLNDGEWEVKRLGEVCRLTNGMAFKPSDWIETGIPIVRIQNLNDENAPFNYCAPEIIDDRCMIDTGTLLFSWSGTPGTSFGAFIWNRGKAVLNQHIFIVKPVEIDKVFLKMAIDANMTSIIEKSHGGAGLRHITKSDFEDIRISVPKDIAEQRRIAACLSALDEMLAATNGKLEQLKAYKKGLMQKLFPAKGKKLPELRFKEFEKDGEWEVKKLGEVTKDVNRRNKSNRNLPIYSISNKDGFILQSEQFDGLNSVSRGYDTSLYKIVTSNTFAYNPARINVGSIGYSGNIKECLISSLYVCFKTTEDVDDSFLMYFFDTSSFNQSVENNVEGGIRSYLFYENFSKIKIMFPTVLEQKKITSCLKAVDEEINAISDKTAELEKQKTGLMQKLFPITNNN